MPLNRGWSYREQVGPGGAGLTALAYLATTRSHSTTAEWADRFARDEIAIDGTRADPATLLQLGQIIVWHRPPWDEPAVPTQFAIVHEDDSIVAVDGRPVTGNDQLIQLIAARQPGTTATVQIVRDGRALSLPVKLAERPDRERRPANSGESRPLPTIQRRQDLGLSVREIDGESARRFRLPDGTRGVIVSRVEPMSPAFDADVERGHILLEINRRPIRSIADFRRLTGGARSGDVLTLYLYKPEEDQRALLTVRIE